MVAVSDDKQQTYCGINSWIWKFGYKCSIWRNEDVWNTPKECTTREISFVMERLPKSPEAQKDGFETLGADQPYAHIISQ